MPPVLSLKNIQKQYIDIVNYEYIKENMSKIPSHPDRFLPEKPQYNLHIKNIPLLEEIENFERRLEAHWNTEGKYLTRVKYSDLHKSDILHLKFTKNQHNSSQSTTGKNLEVSLRVRWVHGAILFCIARIEKTQSQEPFIGNCTVRLPIVSKLDGGVLARRSFDNLIHEVGPLLTQEEKDTLNEAHLMEIIWIPDYKERIRNIGSNVKNWVKKLF